MYRITLIHEAAEYVHAGDIESALLNDSRVDIGINGRLITREGHGTDTTTPAREFLEFVHIT